MNKSFCGLVILWVSPHTNICVDRFYIYRIFKDYTQKVYLSEYISCVYAD